MSTVVTTVRDLLSLDKVSEGSRILVRGFVEGCRAQKKVTFVRVHDHSSFRSIQIVFPPEFKTHTGAALSVVATVAIPPSGSKEAVELRDPEVIWHGDVANPGESILCTKNEIPFETLRHFEVERVATKRQRAILRIHSAAMYAMTKFFESENVVFTGPNTITSSDCEGAGETFRVSAGDDHFFGKPVYLTVSAQLQLEILQRGLHSVWCFLKSYRAELSHTTRHLAEFEHVEAEFSFYTLQELMDVEERLLHFIISSVLANCDDELAYLEENVQTGLRQKLTATLAPFYRISYTEAVEEILRDAPAEISEGLCWGDDLSSEREKWLSSVHGATQVFNYPAALKAWYMKQNDEDDTVQACDVLLPGLGEIIGSSARETDVAKLETAIARKNLDMSSLTWYIDLRKSRNVPSSGFGLGYERLITYITGAPSIRDVTAFIVATGVCKY
jgi:asparaginyl-tRNA synthetase